MNPPTHKETDMAAPGSAQWLKEQKGKKSSKKGLGKKGHKG
jgi:hypothetical protein